jgi:CubicO group peptidase (beta-lactamase class C family)
MIGATCRVCLRRLLCALGLGAALASGLAGGAAAQPGLESAISRAFEAAGAPAMGVVTATAQGMDALHVRGRHSTLDAMPVAPDARWHLGSNAKAMVATLALVLARDGVLALDEPIAAFFPDVAVHPDLGAQPLAALLRHTSGIAANMTPGQLLSARRSDDTPLAQRAALARDWLERAPETAPGGFAYSNLGYVIAGAAIEARTGRDWFSLLEDAVLSPLGIDSAGLGAPAGDAPEGHASFFGLMLRPEPADSRTADNPAVMGPAGTLHMSLPDYARFLASQLPGGPLLTEAERGVLLRAPDTGAEPPYALGWAHPVHPLGGRVWQHAGSNTLWLVIARIDPAAGRAAAAIANAATPAVDAALRALLDEALPPPPRDARP